MSFIDMETARSMWSSLLVLVSNALLHDFSVVMRNVGTLETYMKQAQRYRHPATGQIRVASPKRHIRLVLSPKMREKLHRRRK